MSRFEKLLDELQRQVGAAVTGDLRATPYNARAAVLAEYKRLYDAASALAGSSYPEERELWDNLRSALAAAGEKPR